MPVIATSIDVGECNTKVNAWATHTTCPFVDVVLEPVGGQVEIRLQFKYEEEIDHLSEALERARDAFHQPDHGDQWHSWVMFSEADKARSRAERGLSDDPADDDWYRARQRARLDKAPGSAIPACETEVIR